MLFEPGIKGGIVHAFLSAELPLATPKRDGVDVLIEFEDVELGMRPCSVKWQLRDEVSRLGLALDAIIYLEFWLAIVIWLACVSSGYIKGVDKLCRFA